MKQRFILFRRGEVFYCEDTATRKQISLRTKDLAEAQRLLHAKNEAVRQPAMNLQIAQVYLQHGDPALTARTWEHAIEQIIASKTGGTLQRWQTAQKDKAFDSLRQRRLIETTAEHFLEVLKRGTVSTNVYLRRLHNYALGMHWLPWPVLPKLHWPRYDSKGNADTARMMTPFLASKPFGSIRSNSTTIFWPSLNGQAHSLAACSIV